MKNEKQYRLGPADTAAEQLADWDAGNIIWSIEMGGLGPGYEQAIQVLAVEILRDNIGKPLPVDKFNDWGDSTVSRIDYQKPDGTWAMGGYSGAQVGAAKHLAYRWLRDGPKACLASCSDTSRHIQVSKNFPVAP